MYLDDRQPADLDGAGRDDGAARPDLGRTYR
jgi:hypothetical protein